MIDNTAHAHFLQPVLNYFMNLTMFFICWFLIGIATAYSAHAKGRDPYIWFTLGLLFGLFGFVLISVLPSKSGEGGISQNVVPNSNGSPLVIEATPDKRHAHHEFLVKDWYYINANKKQEGPLSFDRLKSLWLEEKLGPYTFLWSEGMQDWKKLQELPDLLESLNLDYAPKSRLTIAETDQ